MPIALVHNGNIVNAKKLRDSLEAQGSLFQGTADSEIILHLIARSQYSSIEDRLHDALNQLKGAFSLLLLTPQHLYAIVDPVGYRPLVLGHVKMESKSHHAWAFQVNLVLLISFVPIMFVIFCQGKC